jgi:hypothetical protein
VIESRAKALEETEDVARKKFRDAKRLLLTFAPFLILLIAFLVLQVSGWSRPSVVASTVVPEDPEQVSALAASTPAELLRANTPTPGSADGQAATSQPTMTATAALVAPIELLGPPTNSALPDSAPVVFIWHWGQSSTDNLQSSVVLRNEQQQLQVGNLTEPNLGKEHYQIQIDPEQLALPGGQYEWWVQVRQIVPSVVLAESPTRSLTIRPAEPGN